MASFSDDREYADLQIISFNDVVIREPLSILNLVTACKNDGFFYLNLAESPQFKILQYVSDLMTASEAFFNLPLPEKMLFDTDKLGQLKNYGYKPLGRNTGVGDGTQDGHEIFLAPRDMLLKLDSSSNGLSYPEKLKKDVSLLQQFSIDSHKICLKILECLSTLTEHDPFTPPHHPDFPSTSAAALIKYPRQDPAANQAGHIAHTDVGSLTLLFSHRSGLQIFHPLHSKWQSVAPIPGHAVVNIGDSLRHLSGRVFKSCLHRVLPCTTDQAHDRYSVIYFMRPAEEAEFTDASGKVWKSVDWHMRKFDSFRHEDAKEVERVLRGKL